MALTKVTRNLLSTGIDDQSNATAITIDSSENVGIGTSSPDRFTISGGGSVTDGTTLTIDSGSNTNKMPKLELAAYNVANGNDIGQIIFGHFGGDATADGYGVIAAERVSGGGDGDIALTFGTGSSGTERMTISSIGDMHLGQSDSDVKFYIGSQGGGFGGNASHNIRASGSSVLFNAGGASGLYTFEVNGSEKMRLDSSGNMLVGTTSNSRGGRAVINGSAGDILKLSGGASGYLGLYITQNQANNHIYCDNLSTAQFYVTTSTGDYYFSGGSLSDRDLKENIASVPDGSLDLIKALTPRTFNFKAEENFSTKIKTGFIAQEVAEVITEGNVATGTDGQKDMAVDTTGIVAHLVKAIQEQQTIIDDLKARIETLENA
jgi:hypothetical protein